MQAFKIYSLIFSFGWLFSFQGLAQNKTWTEDIAPLIHANCSSCHHDGGIAPFSLITFDEVVDNAFDIHHAIDTREMPPWPADPEYRHFANEAYLEQWEIDAIHNWIDHDFPFGDENNEPIPPVFGAEGALLEDIDFTISIPPYTLQSDIDEYRWFVIENPFDEPIYISKLEVIPGLENVVHHADLFLDHTGNSLANDLQDPLPGFNQSTGTATNNFYINAWQPGANIAEYPKDWGILVPPESDFVIEIHYGPNGIGLVDSTKMHIQLTSSAENIRPVKVGWLLNHGNMIDGALTIPADEVVSFHQVSAPLAQSMSLISICPHMHYLGKSYKVWYETQQGDSIPLIDIPRWDFHWQKYYQFQQVEKIPAGAVIKSEGYYDNTLDNHDNPSDPPVTVSQGLLTEDEMFLCYFIFADYQAGDENIVLDSTILITDITTTKPEYPLAFEVFPNPTKDHLFIKGKEPINVPIQFFIVDTKGAILRTEKRQHISNGAAIVLNVNALNAGIYFLEWTYNGIKQSIPFVKN